MADKTAIEWSDATLNLWFGCTQLSPACDHCYAMRWGPRLGVAWNGPPKRAADSAFAKILGYQRSSKRYNALHGRPRRVFINSLSDFFDNQAEQSWRDLACVDMEAACDVIFILVTKRPQNVSRMVPAHWIRGRWPTNVWLLVTAENQEWYNRRVAIAMTIPGLPWCGISMEPMLEPIHPGKSISLSAVERSNWARQHNPRPFDTVNELGWVIIGGESGPKARSMPPIEKVHEAARLLHAGGRAIFIKQMSQRDHPDTYKDISTFPPGLRVRLWPKSEGAAR